MSEVAQIPPTFDAVWGVLMAHPKAALSYTSERAMNNGKNFYRLALAGVPPGVLMAAVMYVIGRSEFLPAPSQILDAAKLLTMPAKKTGLEAWNDVLAAIGSGRPVTDPVALKALGGERGVRAVGQTDEDHIGTARAHFIKAYEAIDERERENAFISPQVKQLLGPIEARQIGEGDGEKGR